MEREFPFGEPGEDEPGVGAWNARQRRGFRRQAELIAGAAANTVLGMAYKRTKYSTPAKTAVKKSVSKAVTRKIQRAAHELKFSDYTATGAAVIQNPTTGIQLLNAIDQGSGATQRQGRKVVIEGIHIKGFVTSSATTTPADLVRIVILEDKFCRGAVTTASDWTTNNTAHNWLCTHMDVDNLTARRFRILFDRTVKINTSVSTGVYNYATFQKNIKCRVPVNYLNTTGGGIADIDSGSIYIWAMNDAVSNAALTYECRVKFRDL